MLNSPIDEIKNRLDIVDVIGSYIKLQKAGANYRALCPFHSEKKPSLFVSPSRQIWKCFGCGKSGDIFAFVKEIEGVEFGDALRTLAQKAGVELKRPSPELIELQTERQRLYGVCEWATRFFEKQLESKTGKAVKEYLLNRGLTEATIKRWRVGYAPDIWQGLADFLTGQGYQKEEIEKAGLEIKNEKGGFYDRFRGRIIFPIFDLNSQIVGFGGRIFRDEKEVAKYVNTPGTLLYDKSRVLYGLDKAKVEIRKKDSCILVEGYMDAILVSQGGFENVVAVSGTALTPYQLTILKRYSQNLYTAFDMDVAGDTATKRGIDLAQAQGFNVKIIVMPEDKDPADVVSEDPARFGKLIDEAKSILEFYFQTTFSRFDSEKIEEKVEISKILLPIIKRIPNKIEQSYWLKELSKRLKVDEEDLETEIKKITFQHSAFSETSAEPRINISGGGRKNLLEERVVSLILKHPPYLSLVSENYFPYFSAKFREILNYLKQNPNFKTDSLSKNWKGDPQLTDFLNELCLQSEVDYNPLESQFDSKDRPDPEEEVKTCLQEIENLEIKNELDQISKQLKSAEEERDSKKTESLLQKFNHLSQKLVNKPGI